MKSNGRVNMSKASTTTSASNASTVSDRVVEFILTREVSDLENLTVSSIARSFEINRSYLSQRFKSDKSFSLHDYIVMVKILRAMSLLEKEDSLTVDVLSRKMGFSSSDYFTRVFKKVIGTTPGKYKKCYMSLKPSRKGKKKKK